MVEELAKMDDDTTQKGDIRRYFPFSNYLPFQYESIEDILKTFLDEEKPYFILESPTGSGKSGIAYTIGKVLASKGGNNSSHGPSVIVCTKTRALQVLYSKFRGAAVLWSATNYRCNLMPGDYDFYFGSHLCKKLACPKYRECHYVIDKEKFMKSEVGILNYHYFLQSKEFNPPILIFDEAHNLEQILCETLSLTVSTRTMERIIDSAKEELLSVDEPAIHTVLDHILRIQVYDDKARLLLKCFKTNLLEIKEILIERLTDLIVKGDVKRSKGLSSSIILIDSLIRKTTNLLISKVNWVVSEPKDSSIVFKPLEVSELAQTILSRSKYTLMMSATICGQNQFAKDLNIPNEKFLYRSNPSTFPVENRKVWSLNIGSVNNKNRATMLKTFTVVMDGIIDKLEVLIGKSRGIIHAVSYDNARLIVSNSKHMNRMVIPTNAQLMNLKKLLKTEGLILVTPCFTPETKVSLLDGTEVEIKDLIGRKEFYVYSRDLNTGQIIPGRAHSCRKTGIQQPILKVTLDNGEVIRCTYNHPFLLKNGRYKIANKLIVGDSLSPLYRRLDKRGYEEVKQKDIWQSTHRLVYHWKYGKTLKKLEMAHHKDYNKNNNEPSNILAINPQYHIIFHSKRNKYLASIGKHNFQKKEAIEATKLRLKDNHPWSSEKAKKNTSIRTRDSNLEKYKSGNHYCQTEEFQIMMKDRNDRFRQDGNCPLTTPYAKEKLIERLYNRTDASYKDGVHPMKKEVNKQIVSNALSKRLKESYLLGNHITQKRPNFMNHIRWKHNGKYDDCKICNKIEISNHKVLSIENDGFSDVYDFTVDRYHNFALTAGVFVHNSALEGLDLVEDMSRFQFFPKIPYPSLGDAWTRTKLEKDPNWYSRETIIKLVQGSGRSIRSADDYAYTFILDSNFKRLWDDHKDMFPYWFIPSVTFDKKMPQARIHEVTK